MPANFLRILVLFPLLSSLLQTQPSAGVLIGEPSQGDIVRGVVQVIGNASVEGFVSYDLVYAFENSAAPNWFAISNGNQTVNGGVLGSWDTTTITDGDYSLKLIVHLQGGSQQESLIQHVLVRNYTASDGSAGSTEISPALNGNGEAQGAGTSTQPDIKGNPAALPQGELLHAITLGLVGGIGVIVLVGIYFWLRRLSRR